MQNSTAKNSLVVQNITQFKLSKLTLNSLSKFNISPTAKLVLLYLIDCYNPAKQYIFPRQETIADKLGISLSSVKRAIKELSKANVIIIELKFSNRYSLTSNFFNLIKLTPDTAQIESVKCQNETNHVLTEKENIKKQPFGDFKNKFGNEIDFATKNKKEPESSSKSVQTTKEYLLELRTNNALAAPPPKDIFKLFNKCVK